MNKQFDVFVKMKIKEMCSTISDMTKAYTNPETKKPTEVPPSHYENILKQPVQVMVGDQVKRQFLSIMYKQMKALKEEEPQLFAKTLLLMDLNKTPESLSLDEEVALNITTAQLMNLEKEQKKKFHLLDQQYHEMFTETVNDKDLIANEIGLNDPDDLERHKKEMEKAIMSSKKDDHDLLN